MRSRASGATRTLALSALLLACGDDVAPPAGTAVHRKEKDASMAGDPDASADPPQSSPRPLDGGPRFPDADEEVVLEPGASEVVRITITAGIAALDAHLSIDTTESMTGEIDNLQRDLAETVVVGLVERVPDVRFGVSRFEDFPDAPYGFAGDDGAQPADAPFRLLTPITGDLELVATAVASLDAPLGLGGDVPESGAEALWQIATGEGYHVRGQTLVKRFQGGPDASESGGGVGFREGALKVVLHVTDAPSHVPEDYGNRFPRTHTLDEAAAALREIDAKLVGIASGACKQTPCEIEDLRARRDLEFVAHETRSWVAPDADGLCPHGVGGQLRPSYEDTCPLVFDVADDGSGLSDTIVDAIAALVDGIRFEAVHGVASDDPLGFVQRIVPTEVPQADEVEAPAIDDLLPMDEPDGEPDSFVDVRREVELAFDIHLKNLNVTQSDVPQRFRLVVQILGDGLVLRERVMRVVVPAATSAPRDAGLADQDGG